jgi:subtilase family serine protease
VIAGVKAALRAHGFHSFSVAKNGLSLTFTGSPKAVESTFHTGQVRLRGGRFSNLRTPLLVGPLASIEEIFGLSNGKSVFSHATRMPHRQAVVAHGASTNLHLKSSPPLTPCVDATSGFARSKANFPVDFADHYAFKALYDAQDFGQGVHIGIQQFEAFTPSDIAAYQACLGTSTTVNTFDINGGPNPNDAQLGEAALDIEVVIGQAPQAIIDVYQAQNDGLSSYNVLSAMVTSNTDQILVTSWGVCENLLSKSATSANELLYLEASVQGQSFIAAAGDDGSQDCTSGAVGVDSPASQPSVLGVGGTSRVNGADQVWNTYDAAHPEFDKAGGGGISTVSCMAFAQEQSATIPGIVNSSSVHDSTCNGPTDAPYRRQVPDVSAVADPATGYPIFYNGQWQLYGGTSAAAPLWAAIGALVDASPFCSSYGSGFPGVQVSLLYEAAGDAWGQMFTDVTVGNNDLHHGLGGLYPATTGYDEASGLGTPLVVGLDGLGVSRLELPGLAARICKLAASTNKIPAVSSFTPSAILPGSATTVTVSGKGFLTIAGSTVLHLDADHSVIATCVSSTSCTFNSGSLPTGTYLPTIEVEKLASSLTPTFTVSDPTSTSLVVTASPSAATYGAQSTLRGVISPSGVTGSVAFSTGANVLCSGTIVSGVATCLTPKSLGVGTYEVLGSFGGAGPFAASSGLTSLEITRSSTSVAVSASPAAPLPGATVVVTARSHQVMQQAQLKSPLVMAVRAPSASLRESGHVLLLLRPCSDLSQCERSTEATRSEMGQTRLVHSRFSRSQR